MSAEPMLDYVKAAAVAIDLPLDAARAQRVAQTLAQTAALVAPLKALELTPEQELAEIYRPAPFPAPASGGNTGTAS